MTTKIPVELSSTPGIVDGSNATAITIDSSENVGIGTTSPSKKLVISDGGNQGIELSPAESGVSRLFSYNRGTSAYTTLQIQGADLRFFTNASSNAERMRIDSSGNVLIGTSTNLGVLTVKAPSSDDNDIITITEDGTNQAFSINSNFAGAGSTGNNITLDSYWTNDIITFRGDGAVGIGTASPTSGAGWDKFVNISGGTSNAVVLDGTDSQQAGVGAVDGLYIDCVGHTTSSNNKIIFRTASSNSSYSGTERMRIASNGTVGIGNTSPSYLLDVKNDADADTPLIRIRNESTGSSAASRLYMTANGNNFSLYNYGDGTSYANETRFRSSAGGSYFTFAPGSSEKMRIDSSGAVGIGETTPTHNSTTRLYLKGNEHVMSIRNLSTSSAGERVSIDFLDHNGTRRGYISVDTSGTLYSTSSDYRLKNVIEPVSNGIERINKLNPVKFEWKETGKKEEGFIAHEVDEIFKDAVGGEKDAVKEDGSINAQTMDYGRITPLLVKAIQEQQTIIEDLKARIETLES
jgi:hypothetical protein